MLNQDSLGQNWTAQVTSEVSTRPRTYGQHVILWGEVVFWIFNSEPCTCRMTISEESQVCINGVASRASLAWSHCRHRTSMFLVAFSPSADLHLPTDARCCARMPRSDIHLPAFGAVLQRPCGPIAWVPRRPKGCCSRATLGGHMWSPWHEPLGRQQGSEILRMIGCIRTTVILNTMEVAIVDLIANINPQEAVWKLELDRFKTIITFRQLLRWGDSIQEEYENLILESVLNRLGMWKDSFCAQIRDCRSPPHRAPHRGRSATHAWHRSTACHLLLSRLTKVFDHTSWDSASCWYTLTCYRLVGVSHVL